MRVLRLKDTMVKEMVRLATQKDFRNSRKRCVVAGTKLVRDLGRRYPFHQLLTSREDDPQLAGLRCESYHIANARSLRRIAQLTDFDGLVGTLDLPMPSEDLSDPRLLLCVDYVDDPGLLGTLLRTAVAFQWQAAFFLPHCVDPFHPVCVRASQGALFEIPHCRGTMEDLQKLCKAKRLPLCVSHSDGTDIGSTAYEPPKRGLALLLREEYTSPWGPPRSALKIKVPDPWLHRLEEPPDNMPFDPRSLDVAVAGGILMHHIKHIHYPWVSRSPYVASPG
mmetsp:Transcript_25513/g.69617  ORF Transcript_25513/g.69617 Transcript_25513/m.69617 type:complete len:279 (-) Transcript_25513:77-913(-)